MAIPSRQIGWGTESNLLWQILKQLNKLTSVLFGLKEAATPNYKVFTALVTQTGTSSTVNATSGLLIVGVSYLIDVYNAGDDFSNVGGPAAGLQGEWDGYSFLATGTTPNNWNNLSGLDYNEGAPVATVLENTIGNIWFTYIGAGLYHMQSSGLFLNDKTWYSILANLNGGSSHIFNLTYIDDSTILVETVGGDDLLNNTPIEIRVYN
jgi:hypothetical protein